MLFNSVEQLIQLRVSNSVGNRDYDYRILMVEKGFVLIYPGMYSYYDISKVSSTGALISHMPVESIEGKERLKQLPQIRKRLRELLKIEKYRNILDGA